MIVSGNLTSDEIAFIEKIDKERKLHANAQNKYRKRKLQNDPEYKTKINEYMKKYNENKQNKYIQIKKKLISEAPPKTILLSSLENNNKVDRRTKKGKRQAADIIPSYKTRKSDLKGNTIETYISQANTVHRLFTNHNLSPQLKDELYKLMNNDDNVNEKFIIDNMNYLIDITPTIEELRANNYQILSKLGKNVNEAVQNKRDENKLEEHEKDKIIDLDRNVILKNLNLLSNIKDRLIYAIYTLQPARRLDWRHTVITRETDEKKLEDAKLNFLSISPKGRKAIFNNYKTDIKYEQQVFPILDPELNKIIDTYIAIKKLKEGNYLFSLESNKKKEMAESNFSKKVVEVFYKVYKEPISVRFIRMSWISALMKTNPTNIQMKKLADEMAHSKEEQSKYNKILRN